MSTLTALLYDLEASALEGLQVADRAVPESLIITGELTWDNRCPGYVFVRYVDAAPTGSAECQAQMEHTIAVGILRCVPVIDDEGEAPPTDSLTDTSISVIEDGEVILKAITCDFDWQAYRTKYSIVQWQPLGPNGGFQGGEWQFTVKFPGPCGC